MARPKKDNADYYSHDAGMRNDPKIKALRRRFGLEGYAVYNMLLEALTASNHFTLELTPLALELLAGDFDTTSDTLSAIVDYGVTVELFCREGNHVYSAGLRKRLAQVVEKRANSRNRFQEQERGGNGGFCDRNPTETGQSAAESTQKKGKETKGKETTTAGRANAPNAAAAAGGNSAKPGQEQPHPAPAHPSGPPGSASPVMKPVEQLAGEAATNRDVLADAARRLGTPAEGYPQLEEYLPAYLQEFVVHIRSRGTLFSTTHDFRDHFANWLPIRVNDRRKPAITQTATQSPTTTDAANERQKLEEKTRRLAAGERR